MPARPGASDAPARSCLGRKESDYVSPERAAMIEEAERASHRGARSPTKCIEERTTPDGTTQWFLINHIPILDESGAVTNLATIERDITERKLMEMRLRQADKMQALGNARRRRRARLQQPADGGSRQPRSRLPPRSRRSAADAASAERHLCGRAGRVPDAAAPELQPPARPEAAGGRRQPGHHAA